MNINENTILDKKINKNNNYNLSEKLRFIIPSLIGLMLFIVPLPYGEEINIGVGYLAGLFKGQFAALLPGFMTIVVVMTALFTLYVKVAQPSFVMNNETLKELFDITPLWAAFRVIGGVFIVLTYLQVGPEFITSGATGGTLLNDLMPTLATWFLFSGIFLPLLMNYGLMDFFGTLIRKIMRPLFMVPGRSAIDGIASWIGSGPVGIVLTNKQLQQGYYTEKEAAIISVCFSLVSLPFATVVASFLDIQQYFLPFYLTISIASFVCAVILPRCYPLCKMSDTYIADKQINEELPEGVTLSQFAFMNGVERAKISGSIKETMIHGFKIVFEVYVGLMPLVMCFGTLSLIVAEKTPIFTIVSYPIIFLLEAMRIPGATEAAPAVLVGFADMFLPSILVANVPYEITRFIIGALSFTQLIYMTETGAIIIKSDIPLKLKDLFVIFLLRTAITLPIITVIAHMIF